jgi:hypothetical protein
MVRTPGKLTGESPEQTYINSKGLTCSQIPTKKEITGVTDIFLDTSAYATSQNFNQSRGLLLSLKNETSKKIREKVIVRSAVRV